MLKLSTKLKQIIRKGTIIILLFIASLILLIILALFLGLSSRDRQVLSQQYINFTSNGQQRKYLISKPSRTDENSRIVIGIHGFTDTARRFAYYTGLHNTVANNDIVIYPQAIEPKAGQSNGWNAEFCCGSGWKQGVDDAKYIIELVKFIKQDSNIADAKVYVTGFSNGAFMTQKMAINYPDDINAIAFSAGSIGTKTRKLNPTKPIPVLMLHGQEDKTVPIAGGAKASEPDFDWLPMSKTIEEWKAVNKDKYPVKTQIFPGDGHVWHDWRIINFWHRQPDASKQIVNFFDNYSK